MNNQMGIEAAKIKFESEKMKLLIKNEAGMCYTGFNPDGSETVICKSFGDCSSEELSLVIKTAELLGQRVNFLVG